MGILDTDSTSVYYCLHNGIMPVARAAVPEAR